MLLPHDGLPAPRYIPAAAPDEGPSAADGPSRAFRGPIPSPQDDMNKDKLDRLDELAKQLGELRGYL